MSRWLASRNIEAELNESCERMKGMLATAQLSMLNFGALAELLAKQALKEVR